METLAAKTGATVRAPEMRPALEAAQELDRACADADIQIALHVVGAGDEERVTFTLDVGRTLEPGKAYEAMVRSARERGGRLVDDNGAALDDRTLAAIGAQIEAVRQDLVGRGIEPGSPLALRLFS